MSRPKTRPDPNSADPLSEPTLNRRLWAAYLHRGYTRASFAKAIRSTYANVNDYDKGAKTPRLDKLIAASELLGFSLDELCFGYARSRRGAEPELTHDAIRALLDEVRATAEARDALEHGAGKYQRLTRAFVAGFVSAFVAERELKRNYDDALQAAKEEAYKQQAIADAVALQAIAPTTRVDLARLGREADGAPPLVALPGGAPPLSAATKRRAGKRPKSPPRKRRNG